MTEPLEDFWPENFVTSQDDPAPAVLLKEQARILANRTNGLVEGVVKVSTVAGTVDHALDLNAPALGDSMFKILHIEIPVAQGPVKPFSLTAADSFHNPEVTFEDMGTFRKWLKTVLSSELVGSVVGNLTKRSGKPVSS